MFPPAFGPRMGYLCKYMKRAGWEPVVVTEQINDTTFAFLAENAQVTYVHFYNATGTFLKKIEWLTIFLLDFFFHYKDRKMAKVAASLLKEGGYAGVLCSTFRTFPLPAAQAVASRFNLPFIVDLRDIVEQYAANEYIAHSFHTFPWLDNKIISLFRNRLLKARNKVLGKADHITTVSPWHVETIRLYNPCTELIYNGYDPDLFYPKQQQAPRFLLTYTGRLVSLGTRDPQLLFEAMARLEKDKHITPDTFRIQWYVDKESEEILKEEVSRYNLSGYMDYYGYVPASDIPDILNQSSILLQLANKFSNKGPKGIMTTKLFESLAVEKPLLCVRSDESFLEETIRQTRSGVAARTADEAYQFILSQYRIWEEKGYTTAPVNREAIAHFSRKHQAEQFMSIFTELNSKKN